MVSSYFSADETAAMIISVEANGVYSLFKYVNKTIIDNMAKPTWGQGEKHKRAMRFANAYHLNKDFVERLNTELVSTDNILHN